MGNFLPKEFALYFTTKVQYLNLNKFKGTTTASTCNFYLLKTGKKSEHNGHLSVLQTKQITQIQKNRQKMADHFWKNRLFRRHFSHQF